MMTSPNVNIFRVAGPLCGDRWIPLPKASSAELWYFFLSAPWINGWVNNNEAGDISRSLWRHCNELPWVQILTHALPLLMEDTMIYGSVYILQYVYINVYIALCITNRLWNRLCRKYMLLYPRQQRHLDLHQLTSIRHESVGSMSNWCRSEGLCYVGHKLLSRRFDNNISFMDVLGVVDEYRYVYYYVFDLLSYIKLIQLQPD